MDSGQQWRKSAPVIANITRPSWMWFIIIAYMRTPVGMWQVGGLALVGGEVGRRRRSEEGMLRRAKCGKTGWQKSWMKKSKIQSLRFWWWCQTMSRGGYAAVSGAGVWKGVSNKKKRKKRKSCGDNKLLVSATTTSETRIHGGRCVPSRLPFAVAVLLNRDD